MKCSLVNPLVFIGQRKIGEYTVECDVYTGSVEIRILSDNKEMSVGEKRNKLINMAKGEYFSFIDDDDLVSEEYVDQVLRKLRKNPDVVTFWGLLAESDTSGTTLSW